jgi:ribonuclease D
MASAPRENKAKTAQKESKSVKIEPYNPYKAKNAWKALKLTVNRKELAYVRIIKRYKEQKALREALYMYRAG